MQIRLNPGLDVPELAHALRRNSRIQIHNVFTDEVAGFLGDCLRRHTPWRLVHSDERGEPVQISARDFAALGEEQRQAYIMRIVARAGASYQFIYSCYPIIEAIQKGEDTGHPLHAFAEFMNGTDFIRFARELTGVNSIVKADPQATLYSPGHFLNLHNDMTHEAPGDLSSRRFAFVFGFTKPWDANWGGNLVFFNRDGTAIEETWVPGFNVLSLFAVPTAHAVSYVAPFATAGRYSITGWLRDDPRVTRPDLD